MSDRNGKIFCTSIASLSHISKATGNAATAFFTGPGATGAYVVIDNVTKEIIQISDRFDPNWIIDQTIKLFN